MSESIERNDLEEVEPVAEVKQQQRKKRVLTEAQKEAVALNLAKGREKLKQVHLEKQAKRGEELQEKVLKKEKSSVKSKSAEDKRIDLALQALEMVKGNSNNIETENDEVSPKPTPRKKSIKKSQEEEDTEVDEVIIKKRKPKKTIVYVEDTETETEQVKPKRSYRKRVEDKKEQEHISAPTPIPQQQQIIFY